jgi:SAM-dependent methyltransferase
MSEKKEWFANWFDSPYYDLLYQGLNEAEAALFVDALLGYLAKPAPAKVLDLPCGKGRHSIYLHQKGYEVVGADLSIRSIHYAKQFENDRLRFFQHDMREAFPLAGFDMVLNLFTSFGYFDHVGDNVKVLQSVCNAMKPDGVFVLDYFNGEKVKNNLVVYNEKVFDEARFVIQKKVEDGKVVKDIDLILPSCSQHFQEKVQLFGLADFERLFTEANLQIEQVFGDYQLGKFDVQNSDRLIVIASQRSSK